MAERKLNQVFMGSPKLEVFCIQNPDGDIYALSSLQQLSTTIGVDPKKLSVIIICLTNMLQGMF